MPHALTSAQKAYCETAAILDLNTREEPGYKVAESSNFKKCYDNLNYFFVNFADSHHSPGGQKSLYGGDIKLTKLQDENMKKYGNPYGPQSRAASNVPSERWPNAVIPYTFDCSVGKQTNATKLLIWKTIIDWLTDWLNDSFIKWLIENSGVDLTNIQNKTLKLISDMQ